MVVTHNRLVPGSSPGWPTNTKAPALCGGIFYSKGHPGLESPAMAKPARKTVLRTVFQGVGQVTGWHTGPP